ncbi:MAG TPA: type II toxin-antitoxin system VapC family toxin [Longimicrobiaceae bacterium]
MILVDSNIIIYASDAAYWQLREKVIKAAPAVSAISFVETLGYHQLAAQQKKGLEEFFAVAEMLPIDGPVLDQAVRLRQMKRMSLGDALIAGTALVHGLTLATRNVRDFRWISGLTVTDPLTSN